MCTEPRRALLALAVLLAAWAPGRPAAACDSSSCSLLTRSDGGLLPPRKLRLDLSFGYGSQDRLLRGSQEVQSVLRPRVFLENGSIVPDFHRDVDGYDRALQLDLSYGLSSRFNLVASVPLLIWHAHDVAHGSLSQQYGTRGFGDVLLGFRTRPGPRGLLLGASLKLPTGAYRVPGEFGGGIQDPTLQPGTGALAGVAYAQQSWGGGGFLGLRYQVAGTYQVNATNSLGYRFGNQAILVAGTARPLVGSLSASLQARLAHQGRNRFEGHGVPATGSTTLYVAPGLRWAAPAGVALYGYVSLVPYSYVNEAQLGPDLAVVAGISKLF